jgi:methylenetetrahydrofolate dehydrogenase (NADP+) / methenyltetrahydrofolate cyclohydrolase
MTHTAQDVAIIMYGKPVATEIEARLRVMVPEFVSRHKMVPLLAIVQVGANPASERYIRKKIEACARLGMKAQLYSFPEHIEAEALRDEVARLSDTPGIHGVLVQLPLPAHIEEHDTDAINKFDIFDAIAADKDVDGIGRDAVASLYRAQQERMRFLAGTALAVRRMMAYYHVEAEGKRAVVIGRNDITSKPMLMMLGGRMCNAAAIWCHRYVPKQDQQELIRSADILVTAVGSAQYSIPGAMLKPGAVVFDVATRVLSNGKLTGDVEFEQAKHVASFITPVPGGVGPVTVATLMENLFRAAQFAVGEGQAGYSF